MSVATHLKTAFIKLRIMPLDYPLTTRRLNCEARKALTSSLRRSHGSTFAVKPDDSSIAFKMDQ